MVRLLARVLAEKPAYSTLTSPALATEIDEFNGMAVLIAALEMRSVPALMVKLPGELTPAPPICKVAGPLALPTVTPVVFQLLFTVSVPALTVVEAKFPPPSRVRVCTPDLMSGPAPISAPW